MLRGCRLVRRGSPAGGRWARGRSCWGAAAGRLAGPGAGGARQRSGGRRAESIGFGERRTGRRPPPTPSLSIFPEARLMDSSGAAAHRLGGSRSACRGQHSHVEADLCPGKAGRTAVFASAGDGRGSAQPHTCLKHHLLRLGGRVPACERGRGTAASRPRCRWWPQPGGPRSGRGCVRGHGWPPTHRNCPPGPAHQTIAPPVVFRAGLSCLQIFGSRPQKIPIVSSGSGLLPWVARVTRAGRGGSRAASPVSLSSLRPMLFLLRVASLWFSGAGRSVLTGPQWTALACRRLRFSWTQLRPGTGLPAGDCDASSPLCLQSHPKVSHAAGAFSGGSFVTASPASARGWLPSSGLAPQLPPPACWGFFCTGSTQLCCQRGLSGDSTWPAATGVGRCRPQVPSPSRGGSARGRQPAGGEGERANTFLPHVGACRPHPGGTGWQLHGPQDRVLRQEEVRVGSVRRARGCGLRAGQAGGRGLSLLPAGFRAADSESGCRGSAEHRLRCQGVTGGGVPGMVVVVRALGWNCSFFFFFF